LRGNGNGRTQTKEFFQYTKTDFGFQDIETIKKRQIQEEQFQEG